MRILVFIILTVGAVHVTAPARAQTYDPNYPICLQIYDDMVHDAEGFMRADVERP